MRIRRSASRLLGAAVPVPKPPRFELPPPSPRRFEMPPPPARESHAGVASKTSSSPETCHTCINPVDLMNQLDLSDPVEEERFVEEYSVPLLRRSWWLFTAATMPVSSIKEDKDEKDTAVDRVDGDIPEPHFNEENKSSTKPPRKENESKPKSRKGKEKVEECGDDAEGGGGGGVQILTCKKNDGQSDQKLPDSSRPRRSGSKRASTVGDTVHQAYHSYTRFGLSKSKMRHGSSSPGVPEPPPADEEEDAQLPEAYAVDGVDAIAGLDEEISTDDEDALGCIGEPTRGVMIRKKSLLKKRRRKHVKSRSINSLM